MPTLERAISIAATAHSGQLDKGGQPYILHPLRVMMRVSTLEEKGYPDFDAGTNAKIRFQDIGFILIK